MDEAPPSLERHPEHFARQVIGRSPDAPRQIPVNRHANAVEHHGRPRLVATTRDHLSVGTSDVGVLPLGPGVLHASMLSQIGLRLAPVAL